MLLLCPVLFDSDISSFYSHLLLDSRSTELLQLSHHVGPSSPSILLFHNHVISSTDSNFCLHVTTSFDIFLLVTNKTGEDSFFALISLISLFLIFFPQCTPIVGHGFVLDKYKCQCRRGFYHPRRVALNGFKSRLQIPLWYKNTYCSELSNQNFESFRSKLWSFIGEKKQPLFSVDSHTFCLKFLLCLWTGILGLARLWNLKLSSVLSVEIYFLFWALVGATGGIWITDLLDCKLAT